MSSPHPAPNALFDRRTSGDTMIQGLALHPVNPPDDEVVPVQLPRVVIAAHALLATVVHPVVMPGLRAAVGRVRVATARHRVVGVDTGIVVPNQPTVVRMLTASIEKVAPL
jgi:hypothetical protein